MREDPRFSPESSRRKEGAQLSRTSDIAARREARSALSARLRAAMQRFGLDGTRRGLALWLVVGGSIGLCLVPLWSVRWLPIQEYPLHLGVAEQVRRLLFGTPAPDLWLLHQPHPNFLLPLSWAALGQQIGMDPAGRLLLSVTVVALPLSLSLLLHRWQRPLWPAIFALPLLFGSSMMVGKLDFVWAMPVLVAALSAISGARGRRVVAVAIGAMIVLFCIDITATLLFAALAPLIAWAAPPPDGPPDSSSVHRPGLQALRTSVGVLFGAMPTSIPWWFDTPSFERCTDPTCRWFSIAHVPTHHLQHPLGALVDTELLVPGYHWLLLALLALMLAAALARRPLDTARRQRMLVAPLVVLLIGAVLPDAIDGVDMLGARMVLPLLLLLLLPVGMRPTGAGRIVALVTAALVLAFPVLLDAHWQRRQRELDAIGLHVDALPHHSTVIALPRAPDSWCRKRGPFHYVAGWLVAEGHRGVNLELENATSWLRYRKGPRARLARPRCLAEQGESKHLLAQAWPTIDVLDLPLSGYADFALVARSERPRRRGPFRPLLAGEHFVLLRNTERDSQPIALPAVAHRCSRSRSDAVERARCRHQLDWLGALASCRAWGGELETRRAELPPTEKPLWTGLRFDPRSESWIEHDGTRSPRPAPDFQCMATREGSGEWMTSACSMRAHAVCSHFGDSSPNISRARWWRFSADGFDLLISKRRMTFYEMQHACRRHGGWPVLGLGRPERIRRDFQEQPSTWVYLSRIASNPRLVDGPLWSGRRASPQTPADPHIPWARGQPKRSVQVCLLSDGTAARCDELHAFVCRRPGRRHGAAGGAESARFDAYADRRSRGD